MRVCLIVPENLYKEAENYANSNQVCAGNVSAVIRLALVNFFAGCVTQNGRKGDTCGGRAALESKKAHRAIR